MRFARHRRFPHTPLPTRLRDLVARDILIGCVGPIATGGRQRLLHFAKCKSRGVCCQLVLIKFGKKLALGVWRALRGVGDGCLHYSERPITSSLRCA